MKKKFIVLTLTVFSVLFPIIIIEALLRIFIPVYMADYLWVYQYDNQLGVRVKEQIHFFNTTDYQQEMRANKLGSINFQDSFDQYAKLVFAIGDSFTQGTGLPSDTNYPFQLDLLLNIREGEYHPQYAVVNLGLAAYGMEQAILTLQRYVNKLKAPQYVLYLGSANDFQDDLLFKQGYRHKQLVDGNPQWGLALKPIQTLVYRTEIGKRLLIATKNFIKKKESQRATITLSDNRTPKSIASRLLPQFERLAMISENLGAKLIVGWAAPPTDRDPSYEWLKQWSHEHRIAFADWYPLQRSVLDHIPALPVSNNHSGGHHRVWVNMMIAKAFAKHIVDYMGSIAASATWPP